ncbi:hypothetical protein HZY88_02680 [Aerococcaceae bacterium DSM 111176]|nr:hypothetical protein [Aerococcaceae bacterium DSM 111176]
MTTNNWNYEELGFNSEAEMQASITRVKRKQNMNDIEIRMENLKDGSISKSGGINFDALKDGARLADLDRKVHNKLVADRELKRVQAEQEKMQRLMSGLSESIEKDNRAKAEKEFADEKAKLESELQKEVYSKHGVITDAEAIQRKSLSNLINGAIGKSE